MRPSPIKKGGDFMADLKLFLFGFPRLERDGKAVEINRRKSMALAAYLAVTRKPQSREALATLCWPDLDQKLAQASLRTTLWYMNKIFGPEWLTIGRDHIELHQHKSDWIDVNRFQECLAQSADHRHPEDRFCQVCLISLSQAVEIYQDEFLAGFSLPDNDAFEEWKRSQAQRLNRNLIKALERLIHMHIDRQEYEQALAYAFQLVKADSLNESAHGYLMKLYAWLGQPTSALKQYEECSRILAKELDVKPQESMANLYLAIKEKRFPVLQNQNGQGSFLSEKNKSLMSLPRIPPISAERELLVA